MTVFRPLSLLALTGILAATALADTARLGPWAYVQIDDHKAMWGDFDEPAWLRYFGLATGDVDGDGRTDIVSGRNAYLNPGTPAAPWRKLDLGRNVDACLILDTDGNGRANIVAQALPDIWSFEYTEGTFSGSVIARIPPTGHRNGQGYRVADVIPGAPEEMLFATQGGIFLLSRSEDGNWQAAHVAQDASDEGFAVADIDGDGDLDLASGFRVEGKDPENPTVVVWFENNNQLRTPRPRHPLGTTEHAVDRVEAADLDGDGRCDVIVSEERYPGEQPDANLWVFLQREAQWERRRVVTQYSMNNLDVADMDGDGDIDIITCEHKGPNPALQIWVNDGRARFSKTVVDTGRENHLGARVVDIDGDGDLDIVGIGWDRHQYVHLWINNSR